MDIDKSALENEENSEEKENSEEDEITSDDESNCPSNISEENSKWCYIPDSVLLNIFQYLALKDLIIAGEVCKWWYRVSHDGSLWKPLFHQAYGTDPTIGMVPGKTSWFEEFKRLTYHIPVIQTEELTKHNLEVLHVSFSHNGEMFATCSKDKFIFVWESQHPVKIKYQYNMMLCEWKTTQFSQFNPSDTLLLVSGTHGNVDGEYCGLGEIAVFCLTPDFEIQCKVANNPPSTHATWYNEHYFLSGSLHWIDIELSSSEVMLSKANQKSSRRNVPITQLFSFMNGTGSPPREIMIANCLTSEVQKDQASSSDCADQIVQQKEVKDKEVEDKVVKDKVVKDKEVEDEEVEDKEFEDEDSFISFDNQMRGSLVDRFNNYDCFQNINPLEYTKEYKSQNKKSLLIENSQQHEENLPSTSTEENNVDEVANCYGKYLIFKLGDGTWEAHEVALTKIKNVEFPTRPGRLYTVKEKDWDNKFKIEYERCQKDINAIFNFFAVGDKDDTMDHIIELNGCVQGMRLSPDHRYLYISTRRLQTGSIINMPPPPPTREIDIRVIDLMTLKEVGRMSRVHTAFVEMNLRSNDIFIDVCDEYVASGAEGKDGYLWDRYYGVTLAKFHHSAAVNCVAFNPRDSEMLVTTSDDYTVKIWRSRSKVHELGLNKDPYPRSTEMQK